MTKTQLADKQSCTGCGACGFICPKHAISMERDRGGFLYPKINKEQCVNCVLCAKSCHVINISKNTRLRAYYGWHKDSEVREKSSSGGVFTALAQTVFKMGGVVYGHVVNCEDLSVLCVRAEKEEQLIPMRQSKYVESDITKIYSLIKKDVEDRYVLFCGTPCQCAAIHRQFGKNKNLFLISFVCYGVGAPSLFKEHYSNVKKGKEIKEFLMRDKAFGWHDDAVRIKYYGNNRDYLAHYTQDTYYHCHISLGMYKRDCCYSCKYTDYHLSDITVADYWNVAKTDCNDDNKGISLVIANSEHGNALISKLSDVELNSMPISNCEYAFFDNCSPNSENAIKAIKRKNEFINSVEREGFEKVAKQYMPNPVISFIKSKVKLIIPRSYFKKQE